MEGREQIYSSKPLSDTLSRQVQNSCIAAYSPVWRLKLWVLTKKFTAMKAIIQATMKLLLRDANLSRLIDCSLEYPPDIMTLTDVKKFDELHTTNPQIKKK